MLYLAIVSLLWAVSFGLIGSRLAGVDPFFVAMTRLGLALVVLAPFFRPAALRGTDAWKLFGCGALQFGLMYVSYMYAYTYIPSHLVALFSVSTPLYVVLLYDLRARRWTPLYLGAAYLSVIGAAVIRRTGGTSGELWTGFALMQVSGIAFAFGQVYYRDWKRAHPAATNREIFALLYAGGFALALAVSLCMTDWAQLSVRPQQWGVLAYLGIVASGGGFFLWNKGAVQCNPGTLATFNNAVIPLAMASSLFLFGEIQGATAGDLVRLGIGGLCIGSAVWIAARRPSNAS